MQPAVLKYSEIESRYAGEWVLVGDPVVDEVGHVLSGTVLAHDPDRDTLYDEGIRLMPKHSATLCFQEPDPDTVLVL